MSKTIGVTFDKVSPPNPFEGPTGFTLVKIGEKENNHLNGRNVFDICVAAVGGKGGFSASVWLDLPAEVKAAYSAVAKAHNTSCAKKVGAAGVVAAVFIPESEGDDIDPMEGPGGMEFGVTTNTHNTGKNLFLQALKAKHPEQKISVTDVNPIWKDRPDEVRKAYTEVAVSLNKKAIQAAKALVAVAHAAAVAAAPVHVAAAPVAAPVAPVQAGKKEIVPGFSYPTKKLNGWQLYLYLGGKKEGDKSLQQKMSLLSPIWKKLPKEEVEAWKLMAAELCIAPA